MLDRLAGDAGQPRGEPVTQLTVAELVTATLAESPAGHQIAPEVPPDLAARTLTVQAGNLARALRGLLDNAIAAAGPQGVSLTARADADTLSLDIADRGPGIPPDLLDRVGEPFFTTRPTGKGMGLGVFLARAVVAAHGGRLQLTSEPGAGTRAHVELPLSPPPRAR